MAMFRGFSLARKWIICLCRANAGNVAIIFAIAAIPVVGSIGTAIDLAKANDVGTRLQAALDAAVLAGDTQPSAQHLERRQLYGSHLSAQPGCYHQSGFERDSQ